jgi:hypothetical protein
MRSYDTRSLLLKKTTREGSYPVSNYLNQAVGRKIKQINSAILKVPETALENSYIRIPGTEQFPCNLRDA